MAIAAQSLPGQGLTLNQVELMEQDNVAAETGNLQELGVIPTPIANLVTALAWQPASETTGPGRKRAGVQSRRLFKSIGRHSKTSCFRPDRTSCDLKKRPEAAGSMLAASRTDQSAGAHGFGCRSRRAAMARRTLSRLASTMARSREPGAVRPSSI